MTTAAGVVHGAVDTDGHGSAAPDETSGPSLLLFDAYVRANATRLVRSAFLLTGDHHLAEDLVQTALAKVAPRWPAIVSRGDPTPYVRTVIVRAAVAWGRRHWRAEVPTAAPPDAAGPDTEAGTAERARLRAALLSLPLRQRGAVVLRYYEDLSEADAAAVLRCSVGTIKSQSARGLAKLRAALGEGGAAQGGSE
jgi:RNA polymerase sigma-70 factor (sigma-E family)